VFLRLDPIRREDAVENKNAEERKDEDDDRQDCGDASPPQKPDSQSAPP
jgi:hypothetical protein